MCHLERNWNIRIPGFGGSAPASGASAGSEFKAMKKPQLPEAHKQRLNLVRKSAAAMSSGAGPSSKQQKLH